MYKKSVGIITFHASHNYGSMLQAYALQHVVSDMGFYCEIINFRTKLQKEFYKPLFFHGNILERAKRFIVQFQYIPQILLKDRLFEDFLKKELILSLKEYSSLYELENQPPIYDYYISGSDQIWNEKCFDFDWSYFLPFAKDKKCIAYAPSMGSSPHIEHATIMCSLLKKYIALSVREKDDSECIKRVLGLPVPVLLDPTLLLTRESWMDFTVKEPIIKGKYILLYSPWYFENCYQIAEDLSYRYGMKVIVTQPFEYLSRKKRWKDFKVCPAVGPKEFLNLCRNASFVCCSSFHAVIFSILFNIPFVAYNGMTDSRIANILRLTGLENHSITSVGDYVSLDAGYDHAYAVLSEKRLKSLSWLENSLNL